MDVNEQQRAEFLETLWDFYARSGRSHLPWRQPERAGNFDPYKIMVSELMLQQTQVTRVMPKYPAFLGQFPTIEKLATADLGDVLRAWQGLGYNRRAKFLWQAAQMVYSFGQFPDTAAELVMLPGIGVNTAGAILAYAYNQPVVFVETNVRTAYIHHFFGDQTDISDKQVLALVTQTLERENPREFYWALMDYGSHLKTTVGNANKASKHYTKQSTFHGSRRQVRGQIIRELHTKDMSLASLRVTIPDDRLESVLEDLVNERLIRVNHGTYSL